MKKQKKSHQTGGFKKYLFKGIIYFIIALISLIILGYIYLGSIVKTSVQHIVPPITGTSVSIQDLDLSLLSGHIAVTGLKIGNPKGFNQDNLFSVGSVVVDFDVKSIFTNKIIIKNIHINHTNISAEINKNGQINLAVLQDNINQYIQDNSSTKQEPESTSATNSDDTQSKTVVIKKLTIDNSTVNLGIMEKSIQLPLPNISKTNIGEDQDKQYTLPDMIALILSYFSETSLKAIAQSGTQFIQSGLSDAAFIIDETSKNFTDKTKRVKDTVNQKLKSIFH